MAELVVEQLSKEYPTRGEPLVVLRDVNLRLESGQNLAIVGPSGSGKSTLLHTIGTLDTPTSGRVRLDDADPFALDEARLAVFRSHNIGFVFQEHHLLPQLSVLENVLVPTLASGSATSSQIERAKSLIDRVGLTGRIEHRPAELSGGERQRVAVARALINAPTLLLADEPTGSLDRTTATAIGKLLLELQAEERSILIVVTHSNELSRNLEKRLELDGGELREVA